MVANLKNIKSHPDKFLITQDNGEKGHVDGVIENTKKLTDLRWAELVAIFHDLGKINPNFIDKLDPNKKVSGYANHSYLSAFAFFCAFSCDANNRKNLVSWLDVSNLTGLDILALTIIIAKHHGNLPDFISVNKENEDIARILSKDENDALFSFLESNKDLVINEFAQNYLPFVQDFKHHLSNAKVQTEYRDKLNFDATRNTNPLDFFLDTQFSFASLIQADKTDAARFENLIEANQDDVKAFCESYDKQLTQYLNKLNADSPLNQLRTTIRQEAVKNVLVGLNNGVKVFDLTSPTGSGKTLMLLSLANEILKFSPKPLRIIYALPFLSITEQVEGEILKIFADSIEHIQRIDSKSINYEFEKLQSQLENQPDKQVQMAINLLGFKEKTFAYPLIITTFVHFFETLLSNKNSELLKLPNLSNCIFLIDEIQSLPPRLYSFFVAYLSKFCQKFNCYAIISTATQPNFNLDGIILNGENRKYVNMPNTFFTGYQLPFQLLPLEHFSNKIFNRYSITYVKDYISLSTLVQNIISEKQSVLVILNTIDDTKQLYSLLLDDIGDKTDLILLNTHFTPNDRNYKIEYAKLRLKYEKKIIVISTQLIEAGVDIDFPVLYRDFASVSSIVQSAGRCNRNGKLSQKGKVILFRLLNPNDRSALIYRGKDKAILNFTKEVWRCENYDEKDLLEVQRNFFDKIWTELNFAEHSQLKPKLVFHFLKDIQECMFSKIGSFQLIDEKEYGTELQFYVPKNEEDNSFEILLSLSKQLNEIKEKVEKINKRRQIDFQFKKMANQIVKVRLKNEDTMPDLGNPEQYLNFLFKLNLASYSSDKGVIIKGEDCII
ncbi:MAG: CRISPR-associated helicase Cas3' [Spirosomataceae bacterium]